MCVEVMCLCAVAGHGGSQELTAGLEGLQQLTKLLIAGSWPSVQHLHSFRGLLQLPENLTHLKNT